MTALVELKTMEAATDVPAPRRTSLSAVNKAHQIGGGATDAAAALLRSCVFVARLTRRGHWEPGARPRGRSPDPLALRGQPSALPAQHPRTFAVAPAAVRAP